MLPTKTKRAASIIKFNSLKRKKMKCESNNMKKVERERATKRPSTRVEVVARQ